MTIRIFVFVSLICCFGCQLKPKAQASKLLGITLFQNWDLEKGKSLTDKFTDDIQLIYFDSLVMLRDWIRNVELRERSSISEGDTIRIQQKMRIDTSRLNTIDRYFVYKEGAKFGRAYASLAEPSLGIFNVDSLLAKKALKGAVFYNNNDSLIEETKSSSGFDLAQKYLPKSKPDASYPDSTYMYFTNALNNIRYSFSSELDRKIKMKLAKVVFVYNATIDENGNRVDERKMSFEIKKLELADPAKIIALFHRYKRESKN